MNIKELKALMEAAFRNEGLEELRLISKAPKAWTLPAGDIVRFFWPHPYRRPWGFVYQGTIGIEVPALREWLREHKPGQQAGIFQVAFVGYLTVNEDVFRNFMVEHGKPVPADLWAGLLKDRLEQVPPTLDGLLAAYRRNKEELGWLANPPSRHAWEFLLKWRDNPDPSLHVPTRLPDGRIG
jgi:hypothetical protein